MNKDGARAEEVEGSRKTVDLQNRTNGEEFTRASYHSISILVRKHDGYINAHAMCKQISNKEFYGIGDNKSWIEFTNELKKVLKRIH